MSIRLKIFLCLAGVAGAVWFGMAYMVSTNFLERFDEIDRKRLTSAVNQVLEGMNEENRHLRLALGQWSINTREASDMQARSSAAEFLEQFHLDLLVTFGNSGDVSGVYERSGSRDLLSSTDAAALASMVAGAGQGDVQSGILSLTRGPFLAAAVAGPDGGNFAGAVTGAFLNTNYEQLLRNRMLTDLQFLPPSGEKLNHLRAADASTVWIPDPPKNSDQIEGFSLVRDSAGDPALILKLTDTRHSLLEAEANLRFFLGVSGAAAILIVLIGTLLVETLVVNRIRRLTTSARRADVNAMEDLPPGLSQGRDEIAVLARSMKAMLDGMKSAQLLYRAVVETQRELIVRYKPDGEITLINDAFARFFERNSRAMVGRNILDFLAPARMNNTNILEKLPDGSHRSVTQQFEIFREEKSHWIEWHQRAILDHDRNLIEIQAVGQDITLRRDYEEKLQNAKEAAEAADRSKGEFLAIMSHESRTPLTSILGFVSVLEATPLNERQTEYLNLIRASGDTLLMLLNDVLDYSNVASGRIPLNPTTIGLSSLARELIATHSPEARRKHLDIEASIAHECPPLIEADAGRLKQILHNLLQNAVKFTERGFVRLLIERTGDEEIEFAIQDTGIGIAKEKVDAIFSAFGMTDTGNTRTRGGAGIGLAVSKKLAMLMGGTISVRSEPGLGSRFSLVLPIGNPDPLYVETPDKPAWSEKSNDAMSDSSTYSSLRALVVDDNHVNRLVICRMLEMLGLTVESANSGREALEAINKELYDVVIMDIQMPEMDGFEATQRIRENEEKSPEERHLFIVACTAFDLPGDREKCLASGMDDFLPKPVRLMDLKRTLNSVLPKAEPVGVME